MTTTAQRASARPRPALAPLPARAAPRRGRPLAVAGVAGTVVCALAFAAAYREASGRTPVLAVARPVAAGAVIAPADLSEVEVSAGPGVAVVPAAERPGVLGRRAAVALVPGTLLHPDQLGAGPRLEPGTVLVALALGPGQFPPELGVGDRVTVVRTGTVVAAEARVAGMVPAAGAGPAALVVSLAVPARLGPALAGAPAEGLGLVLVGEGG